MCAYEKHLNVKIIINCWDFTTINDILELNKIPPPTTNLDVKIIETHITFFACCFAQVPRIPHPPPCCLPFTWSSLRMDSGQGSSQITHSEPRRGKTEEREEGEGGGCFRAAVRASLCPETPLSGAASHLTSLPSFTLGAE